MSELLARLGRAPVLQGLIELARRYRRESRLAAANWLIVLFGLMMMQGLGSLNTVIVARRVLPFDLGQYLSSASLAGLLVALPAFGMDAWLLAQGDAQPGRVSELWHGALWARVRLLSVWLMGMLALGLALPRETYPLPVLVAVAVGVAADSLVLLSYSALRLLGQHLKVTVAQSAVALASLAVALLLPVGPGRIAVFAVGRAAVAVAAAAVVVIFTRLLVRRPAAQVPAGPLLRAARPFMLGDLAFLVYSRSSLALIALFGGAGAAGIFGPAANVISLSFLVPNALYYLALPALARAHAAGRRSQFHTVGLVQLAAQAAAGLVISLAIYFLAPWVIRVAFTGVYEAAVPLLRLMSPIPLIKSLNFALGAWLTGSQRQPQRTRVQYVVVAANVLAGVVFIYTAGAVGAASVEIMTELLLCAGYGLAALGGWRGARLALRP